MRRSPAGPPRRGPTRPIRQAGRRRPLPPTCRRFRRSRPAASRRGRGEGERDCGTQKGSGPRVTTNSGHNAARPGSRARHDGFRLTGVRRRARIRRPPGRRAPRRGPSSTCRSGYLGRLMGRIWCQPAFWPLCRKDLCRAAPNQAHEPLGKERPPACEPISAGTQATNLPQLAARPGESNAIPLGPEGMTG